MVRIANQELLALLESNARAPFVEIARKLGVSETAVRKKIRKLEQDGVILGYRLEVDAAKTDRKVDALVGVDAKPDYLYPVIDELKKMRGISCLYSSSGDHMLLIRIRFSDSKELRAFVRKLRGINGVCKVCPAVILERIK